MSKIRYSIDKFSNHAILGWAFSPERPEEHLVIEVMIENRLVSTATASNFRSDLKDSGIGNGDHGFIFNFTPPLTHDELENISIRPQGEDVELTCERHQQIINESKKRTVYLEVSDLINFLRHEKRVTGIQRLVSQLCNALMSIKTIHRYKFCALLSEGNNTFVELEETAFVSLIDAILGDCRSDSLMLFIQNVIDTANLIEPKRSDILLGTGASFSFVNYPLAVKQLKNESDIVYGTIIYDLIPFHSRKTLPPDLSVRFSTWLTQISMISDFVISISDYTNKEFLDFCKNVGVSNPNLRAASIPLGSHVPKIRTTSNLNKRYFFEDDFCIFVSTIETRKNHSGLIQAWKKILASMPNAPQLVIVGKKGWGFEVLPPIISSDDALESKILFIHDASDADLDWLYKKCLFSLYPSLYEGWGLPVTESLARGKFCICSNTTSLPEAGGVYADYFDPTDIGDIARTVLKYLGDRSLLKQKESEIAANFSLRTWCDYTVDLDLWLQSNALSSHTYSLSNSVKPGVVYVFSKNKNWNEDFFNFIENRSIAWSAIDTGKWFVPEDRGRWLEGNYGSLKFLVPKKGIKKNVNIYIKYWLAVNAGVIDFEIRANGEITGAYHLAEDELLGDKLLRCDVKPTDEGLIHIEFYRKKYKKNEHPETRDLFICMLFLAVSINIDQRIEIIESLLN